MNSSRLETNLVVLVRDLVVFLALRDFMTSLDRPREVVSSHLAIFLTNLRNFSEELKEEDQEDKEVVDKKVKEVRI
jgi:hypothetical protein